MNILLDECVPRPLPKLLANHTCRTAQEMGWKPEITLLKRRPGSIGINCFRSQLRTDFVSPDLIIFEASVD